MGPEKIKAVVDQYQQEFGARPKLQAIYKAAAPYQRSVIDRFSTVAAACRMAIEVGLLPWNAEDTDSIETCVTRWAAHDNFNLIVMASCTSDSRGKEATSWPKRPMAAAPNRWDVGCKSLRTNGG